LLAVVDSQLMETQHMAVVAFVQHLVLMVQVVVATAQYLMLLLLLVTNISLLAAAAVVALLVHLSVTLVVAVEV
jgi:hypothetical protein